MMVKVAVMGFGTVGSGVAEVLADNANTITRGTGAEIELKYILDVREFPDSPFADKIINDFELIASDPEIKVVAETIGGIGIAYEFTKRLLSEGKSVVTSNKELVAKKGHELIALAKANNANYFFEASVGGGIPIIRPLNQCLAGNRIDEIYGIVNGTTNYILTQMISCGWDFGFALKKAQENGFAEQDPTADVEGIDALNKICILSDLCFGVGVMPESVKAEGISSVSLKDVEYANRAGYKIKLLARALRTGDDTITAYVAPHLLPPENMLSNVVGVMNGITVKGNAIGEAMLYGPGAGKLATASAVVGDIIDASKHLGVRRFMEWEESREGFVTDSKKLKSKWYVRIEAGKDVSKLGEIVPVDADEGFAFISREMDGYELDDMLKGFMTISRYRVLD